MELEILYDDHQCLVINKPAGIAVHPGHGMQPSEQTVLDGIREYFEDHHLTFSSEAVLVHRLDKDTTGCLLIAKTREVHDLLQKQFEGRTVEKTYLALVTGIPKHSHAIIDAPIGRNIGQRTKMGISRIAKRRDAQTEYQVLQTGTDVALLECKPKTGRTHQIRVHLESIGHPIVGDRKYGKKDRGSSFETHRQCHGEGFCEAKLSRTITGGAPQDDTGRTTTPLCLHAWKLSFDSPVGTRIHTEAPIPKEFRKILEEKCHGSSSSP